LTQHSAASADKNKPSCVSHDVGVNCQVSGCLKTEGCLEYLSFTSQRCDPNIWRQTTSSVRLYKLQIYFVHLHQHIRVFKNKKNEVIMSFISIH